VADRLALAIVNGVFVKLERSLLLLAVLEGSSAAQR
jgi:hypothetical protein